MLEKRSYDSRPFDVRMSNLLAAGETIASAACTVDQKTTPALATGTAVINTATVGYSDGVTEKVGSVVQVIIGAGCTLPDGAPQRYTLRVRCLTNLGNQVEGTVPMLVNDRI